MNNLTGVYLTCNENYHINMQTSLYTTSWLHKTFVHHILFQLNIFKSLIMLLPFIWRNSHIDNSVRVSLIVMVRNCIHPWNNHFYKFLKNYLRNFDQKNNKLKFQIKTLSFSLCNFGLRFNPFPQAFNSFFLSIKQLISFDIPAQHVLFVISIITALRIFFQLKWHFYVKAFHFSFNFVLYPSLGFYV